MEGNSPNKMESAYARTVETAYARRLVVQLGANDHTEQCRWPRCHDPVPGLISRGWQALLFEPLPWAVAELRRRHRRSRAVRVHHSAVCAEASDSGSSTTLWWLNGSSTLSFGANESDVRCLNKAARYELASLSRAHVVRHQRLYRYTPYQCKICGEQLGRALPPNCMSRVVEDNLESTSVPCSNFTEALADYGLDGRLIPPHLLICDVEGADERVIAHYFRTVGLPPQVLIYEHTHLLPQVKARLAAFLRCFGMRRLANSTDVIAHAEAIDERRLVSFLNVSASPNSANHVWVLGSHAHKRRHQW